MLLIPVGQVMSDSCNPTHTRLPIIPLYSLILSQMQNNVHHITVHVYYEKKIEFAIMNDKRKQYIAH